MTSRAGSGVGRGLVVCALVLMSLLGAAIVVTPGAALAASDETATVTPWVGLDDGEEVLELYFVFSSTCPHCQAAIPFVEELATERPWLRVWWLQADAGDAAVAQIAGAVADEIGLPIRGVPTFMACGQMITGYDDPGGVGVELAALVDGCGMREGGAAADTSSTTTSTVTEAVDVPIVGEVAASSVPLPVFTAVVAGLDAFNPCAFFVLLFLLSILVHARSRFRMAAVGGVFVAISGLMYFVFMAAWLNVFLVTGAIRWVTLVAGGVALVLGVLGAKDYFRPDVGPSVSIPDAVRPGLFARMRGLVTEDRLGAVLVATVTLAVVANGYELLCTAGLPMVFTRVLTMSDLSTPAYYGYLAWYNVVYVIPLAAIVAVFVKTLGSRKLSAGEGRVLKLLSGTMMIGLGAVLVLAPDALAHVGIALAVIAGAVVVTAVVVAVSMWWPVRPVSDRARR